MNDVTLERHDQFIVKGTVIFFNEGANNSVDIGVAFGVFALGVGPFEDFVLRKPYFILSWTLLLVAALNALGEAVSTEAPAGVVNAGFERGNLQGWNGWRTKAARTTKTAHSGNYAVQLGPERGRCAQQVNFPQSPSIALMEITLKENVY